MTLSVGIPIMASGARVATGVSGDVGFNADVGVFYLNITAVSGTTPSMTITMQAKDPVSGAYFTLGAFGAKTTTGSERIVVNPLPDTIIRASYVISGTNPSFTFTLTAASLL